ncbi:hypothetical protein SDC9_144545 [bioreactor metagenome]|uniref:DNA polymerase III gamma subunit domain-containing protein n=1 Tax=bioreactor metagenome TaxID=1076179 RepID=A0A645E9R7_9ZZZZ
MNEVEKILENKNSKILLRMVDILMEATVSYKSATNVSSYFEVAVLKMMAIVDEKEQVQIIHKEEVKEVVAPIITASPVIPEVVIEEESIEITEPVKEEVIEKPKKEKNEPDQILSTEFILSLLVSANKETKENDKNSWNQLENKSRDLSCAKCATILKSTMIVASGEDFVVITSDTTAEANQINDLQLNQELHFFIKEQLELDKMIYAVGKENFIEITQEFKERMSRNDLPPSAQITKYKKVVTKEKKKTTEEKLIDLFGQENIDIIEEE